jgi:hypothetical protein
MSTIDNELNLLKQRMATLEEQKRIHAEKEAEKKANPMKVLESFIDNTKKKVDSNAYAKGAQLAAYYDAEKILYLEPILNALLDIRKRLDALEQKEILPKV